MNFNSMKKLFPESFKNSKTYMFLAACTVMIALVAATLWTTTTNEQVSKNTTEQQHKDDQSYANRFAGESISTVASKRTYKTTASLNVRTGPSVKYRIKTKIPKGKKVTYLANSKNGWAKVSYKGKKGYVNKKYLKTVRKVSDSGSSFYVTSTAYTAYCAGCSGRTATGINLRANPSKKVIAVDPRVIPLGSQVYVEGYGMAIAGDTGGAIRGKKIDVFMSSKSKALNWGRRTVKVTVY